MKLSTLLAVVVATTGLLPNSIGADADAKRPRGYIVATLVQDKPGKPTGCRVFPEDAVLAAIYTRAFGPASEADCKKWIKENCAAEKP